VERVPARFLEGLIILPAAWRVFPSYNPPHRTIRSPPASFPFQPCTVGGFPCFDCVSSTHLGRFAPIGSVYSTVRSCLSTIPQKKLLTNLDLANTLPRRALHWFQSSIFHKIAEKFVDFLVKSFDESRFFHAL
jgi:hypothetical protein